MPFSPFNDVNHSISVPIKPFLIAISYAEAPYISLADIVTSLPETFNEMFFPALILEDSILLLIVLTNALSSFE